MGRKKKYSEEELKVAQREWNRLYYEKNINNFIILQFFNDRL